MLRLGVKGAGLYLAISLGSKLLGAAAALLLTPVLTAPVAASVGVGVSVVSSTLAGGLCIAWQRCH